MMMLLLDRRVQITEGAVVQIAESFGEEMMRLLLDRNEVQITEGVVTAAAGNAERLLLDGRRAEQRAKEWAELLSRAKPTPYPHPHGALRRGPSRVSHVSLIQGFWRVASGQPTSAVTPLGVTHWDGLIIT